MRKGLLGGAVIIAAGGLVCKIIGALYRIPLTNIIGAEGIGIYQTVFPVYCALLTLSSTGLPMALSRLIAADEKNGAAYFKKSAIAFGLIGFGGSVIMFVLGGFFARLQGNGGAAACYRALAPSVFFVSLISCVRGYFQGKGRMAPTAVSQVVEQVVKAAVGLVACSRAGENTLLGATYATLAVTVSEVIALALLLVWIKAFGELRAVDVPAGIYKRIFSLVAPVAFASLAIPLGHVADSFIVVNALSRYTENATAAFGVYSGSVAAIVGMPVSLAYGVAVAAIPAMSSGKSASAVEESMLFTGLISLPFAVFLAVFSSQTVQLLYGGLSVAERSLASAVLTADAVSVVFLSFVQTTNAILTAKGLQGVAVRSMGIALAVRAVLCAVLTAIPSIGIFGAVAAANASLLCALVLNLRRALSRCAVKVWLKQMAGILMWSIICVLGGFLVWYAVGGAWGFVFVSVSVFAVYALPPLLKILRVRAKGGKNHCV